VVAGLLRFSTLDVQSYWSDEAITVLLVRMDFGDMIRMIAESESTPPVYYVIAWPWTRVFGSGEIGLRSVSALAGTAAVPIAAAAAWALISRRAAVVAAALAALNPLLIWYAHIGSPRLFGSFMLVETRMVDGYSLLRYRSRRPSLVSPRTIAAGCLRHREVAILLQGGETGNAGRQSGSSRGPYGTRP